MMVKWLLFQLSLFLYGKEFRHLALILLLSFSHVTLFKFMLYLPSLLLVLLFRKAGFSGRLVFRQFTAILDTILSTAFNTAAMYLRQNVFKKRQLQAVGRVW